MLDGTGDPGRRAGRTTAIAVAALAAAVALAGCLQEEGHASLVHAQVRDACLAERDPGACLEGAVLDALAQHGTTAALALVEGLAADPATARHAHALAHSLGHELLARNPTVAAAAAQCPVTMGSGCLHGVVEAHLAHEGADADLRNICHADGKDALHRTQQCWHGVGHGLFMALDDPVAAAARCMPLPDFDARVNCASGVFMENVVGRTPARADQLRPAYPCSALSAVETLVGCWQMQPSLVVATTGNLSAAGSVCAYAGRYTLACESGFGQVAASNERITGDRAEATCELARNQSAGENCLRGVVQDIVTQAAAIQPGLVRCSLVQASVKAVCYRAIGDVHRALESDAAKRATACAKVPEAYEALCIDGSRGRVASSAA